MTDDVADARASAAAPAPAAAVDAGEALLESIAFRFAGREALLAAELPLPEVESELFELVDEPDACGDADSCECECTDFSFSLCIANAEADAAVVPAPD